MTFDEYIEHVKAKRHDCAANCQREAVYAYGVVECPEWAAPAIAEVGWTQAERIIVKRDFETLNKLVHDVRRLLGFVATPYDIEYRAARARLWAMTDVEI